MIALLPGLVSLLWIAYLWLAFIMCQPYDVEEIGSRSSSTDHTRSKPTFLADTALQGIIVCILCLCRIVSFLWLAWRSDYILWIINAEIKVNLKVSKCNCNKNQTLEIIRCEYIGQNSLWFHALSQGNMHSELY